MEETSDQTRRVEPEPSPGVAANAGNSRIEQLCEAVLGLSPEIKSAWYEFKSSATQQQELG